MEVWTRMLMRVVCSYFLCANRWHMYILRKNIEYFSFKRYQISILMNVLEFGVQLVNFFQQLNAMES